MKDIMYYADDQTTKPADTDPAELKAEAEALKDAGVKVAAIIRCFKGGTWGGGAMHIYQIDANGGLFTPKANLPNLGTVEAPAFSSTEELADWFVKTSKNPVSNLRIRWTELE